MAGGRPAWEPGGKALGSGPIHAVADQVGHDARLGERRGVAEIGEIVLGDLAQDPAHDLAGARLGQARRELDQIGRCDWPNLLAHPVLKLGPDLFRGLDAGH